MKSSSYCIIVLSLYSFIIAIIVGQAQLTDTLRTDYLGIVMITLAVAQLIITFIAVYIGSERKNK